MRGENHDWLLLLHDSGKPLPFLDLSFLTCTREELGAWAGQAGAIGSWQQHPCAYPDEQSAAGCRGADYLPSALVIPEGHGDDGDDDDDDARQGYLKLTFLLF